MLLNTKNLINGQTHWSLNNRSIVLPQTPYLSAIKYSIPDAFDQNPPPDSHDIEHYDIYSVPENKNTTSSNATYKIDFNFTVDIILQNANTTTNGTSETDKEQTAQALSRAARASKVTAQDQGGCHDEAIGVVISELHEI